MKAIEALLEEPVIDLTRLKEFCLKCHLTNQLRCTIYKVLIGVLPTSRKSWKFVMMQLREQFEDIYGTMLVIQPDLFHRTLSTASMNDSDCLSSDTLSNTSTTSTTSAATVTGSSSVASGSSNSLNRSILSTPAAIEEHSERIFALYKVYRLLLTDIRERPKIEKEHLAILSGDEERHHILQIIKLISQTCDVQKPPDRQHSSSDSIRLMSDTYWCFSQLMEKYFGANYTHWGDTVYYLTRDLLKFIEGCDPQLYAIVTNEETGHKMQKVFAGWFASLFSSYLTPHKLMRLWDCILLFPIEFLSHIAQAYIKRISAKLQADNSAKRSLSQQLFYLQIEEYEIEFIIQWALSEMNNKKT